MTQAERRRVLVLGGTRFIGAAIVRRLLRGGHQVMVVHRGVHESGPDNAVHLHAGRASLGQHAGEIARFAPDSAVDTAAMTEDDAHYGVSLLGGLVPRVIVLSSLDVYRAYELMHGHHESALEPVPIAETAPLRESRFPRRTRARSPSTVEFAYDKLLVEDVYRAASGIDATILRLPFVYGPGDHRRRVGRVLDALRRCNGHLSLRRDRAGWRCTRAFVEDVALAVELALNKPEASNRTFNLGEPVALSELEWARAIANAASWRGELGIGEAEPEPGGPNWQQDLVLDTTPIRECLGWTERRAVSANVAETVDSIS